MLSLALIFPGRGSPYVGSGRTSTLVRDTLDVYYRIDIAVAFIASDAAGYTTGQVLATDGGLALRG